MDNGGYSSQQRFAQDYDVEAAETLWRAVCMAIAGHIPGPDEIEWQREHGGKGWAAYLVYNLFLASGMKVSEHGALGAYYGLNKRVAIYRRYPELRDVAWRFLRPFYRIGKPQG